jgi:hypothetical protein
VISGDLDRLGGDLSRFFALKPVPNEDGGEIQHHSVSDSLLTLIEFKDGGHYPACSVPVMAGSEATQEQE